LLGAAAGDLYEISVRTPAITAAQSPSDAQAPIARPSPTGSRAVRTCAARGIEAMTAFAPIDPTFPS